jgi:hypothetical protein
MRIYIAGPMRSIPYYNFPEFAKAREKLLLEGFDVVSPADLDLAVGVNPYGLPVDYDWSTLPPGMDFEACLKRDTEAVLSCDAIFMLRGWERSKGARAELALAEWAGKIVNCQDRLIDVTSEIMSPTSPVTGDNGVVRVFETGALRDTAADKLDYEGFLSPLVLEEYAKYMHKHRKMADGSMRDSDNWQKGIPKTQYIKSTFRHFFDFWKEHRGLPTKDGLVAAALGVLFNVSGYLHEHLKETK